MKKSNKPLLLIATKVSHPLKWGDTRLLFFKLAMVIRNPDPFAFKIVALTNQTIKLNAGLKHDIFDFTLHSHVTAGAALLQDVGAIIA